METQTLKAEHREAKGSARARRLRREGKVPAVLYGHRAEAVLLALSADEVHSLVESGQHLVALDLEGRQERALVKEVQFDAWGREILHVDFSRVALDETVALSVEVVSHGTPKGAPSGGVLEQPLHSLEIECRADSIPGQIRVEVGELQTGEMVHVRDLELPEGVRALAEPDTIVFIVREAREEAEEVPAVAAPEAAEEPEVISRTAKEEAEKSKDEEKS